MVDIRDRVIGKVAIVELAGRMTVNDGQGELRQAVSDALTRGATRIVIDLSALKYIDSTRLGELIAAHVTVARRGGQLALANTPPRVMELLTVSGLDDVFKRFGSVDEAVAHLR